jgi:serine/threonine-protein kinase
MLLAENGLPRVAGYEVLRRLSVDATSDVLLARSQGSSGLERVVVLNVLIEPWREDDPALRVLAREVDGYRRLTHPAVARLYDFLADGDHRIVVLEYVDGLPLHRLRALLKTHGRALPDQAAVYIAWRVFGALAAAHGALDASTGRVRSVVHQDINPSHVLVPWDGHVKVGNFGIAVALARGPRAESGLLQGTYGYAAPEQARGVAASTRSDVYSAGLILWELLAGRKAIIRGSTRESSVVEAVAKAEFPPLHELRPDLSKAVLSAVSRALEPDPDKRTIDAQSMCDALRVSGNLEDGRVALVESLSIVRPPAVADMLVEASVRAKVASEVWLEPTRKVDVPVYLGSSGKQDAESGTRGREPANPARDVGSSLPHSRPPVGTAPIVLRMGVPRPRDSEKGSTAPQPVRAPTPVPAASPTSALPSPPTRVPAPPRTPVPASPPTPVPAPPLTPVSAVPSADVAAPAVDAWFQAETVEAPPRATSQSRILQPPPPSPLPPVQTPSPVAKIPRPRLSPALWAVPVAVLVGAAIAAALTWKPLVPDLPTPRQISSTVAVPVLSIDRTRVPSPVQLVPPPSFPVFDAGSRANPPEVDPSDRSRPSQRPGTGTVTVGPTRPGHRVWIDERLMSEESPASYVVPCGKRLIRVGSRGAPQVLDVPCGADIEIK